MVLLLSISINGYKSLAQEESELIFSISNVEEIITQSGVEIDRDISSDGNGSLLINTKEPITVELFELDDKDFGNQRLTYKAQMRSENLQSTEEMRGISPVVFGPGGGGIAPEMMNTLLINMAACTLLFIVLLLERIDLERMKDAVSKLKLNEN